MLINKKWYQQIYTNIFTTFSFYKDFLLKTSDYKMNSKRNNTTWLVMKLMHSREGPSSWCNHRKPLSTEQGLYLSKKKSRTDVKFINFINFLSLFVEQNKTWQKNMDYLNNILFKSSMQKTYCFIIIRRNFKKADRCFKNISINSINSMHNII